MDTAKLKRGIIKVLFANVLNMAFSIGTNFLLPKYLSMDSYAQIKTYQLLISYAAILQLGYSDGMYLYFGGKQLKDIPADDLQKSISTAWVFQGAITVISVIGALIVGDPVVLVAAMAILPQNILAYYKNLFQAVGIFEKYNKLMNYTTGLTFLVNVLLLFVFQSDNYLYYILGYLLLLTFLCIRIEVSIHRESGSSFNLLKFSYKELKEKVASGILLLFANFSSILLTGMDRTFTKFLMTAIDFAQYSFAVSIESFLNIAVSPITVTLYNYFCNTTSEAKIKKLLDLVMGFAALLVAMAFPMKWIIGIFLAEYVDSVPTLFLLFSAQFFLIIVRSIYANLYKARKMQNRYFARMCIVIVLGFVLNCACYFILRTKEAFAIGTMLSSIIWFILSVWDFKDLKLTAGRYVYIGIEVVAFLICGHLNPFVGCGAYIILTLVMLRVFLPHVLHMYMRIVRSILIRIGIVH